jgi:hypothetical protein
MMDFSNYDPHITEQTIDEEFLAYTTANFQPRDIEDADILTFWEVRMFIHLSRVSAITHSFHRQTKQGF